MNLFSLIIVTFGGFMFVSATECPHNLCNYTANYPEKEILEVVSKNTSFNSMFGDIFKPELKQYNSSNHNDNSRNLCPSRQETYQPRLGKNTLGVLRNIVNVDRYMQFVTVEVCEENAKSYIDCLLPLGYESYCKTQFVVIRLVVYKEDKSLGVENFSIPSGCSCNYRFEV